MSAAQQTQEQWILIDHLCRVCWGRVLTRTDDNGQRWYKCSNCEETIAGAAPKCLCACGMTIGRKARDMGIRCVRNPRVSPEVPGAVVAVEMQKTGG